MTEIIIFILSALFLWLCLKWANLVWFRTKTLNVLKQELDYEPNIPGQQSVMFNEVTRSAKKMNHNEYDAAIAFMISQFHVLSSPLTEDAKQFVSEKMMRIHRIMPRSNVGLDLYREFLRSGIYSA